MVFVVAILISIPYGSIKRVIVSDAFTVVSFISIPYGSIKSLPVRCLQTVKAHQFQFLMVQLKD